MWFGEVHCVERVEQLIPRRLRKSWTLVHSAGETYDEIISKSGHKQRSYSNTVLLIYDFSLTFPHHPRGKQVGALLLISCGSSPGGLFHIFLHLFIRFSFMRSAMSFAEWLHTNEEVLLQLLIYTHTHTYNIHLPPVLLLPGLAPYLNSEFWIIESKSGFKLFFSKGGHVNCKPIRSSVCSMLRLSRLHGWTCPPWNLLPLLVLLTITTNALRT